MSHESRRIVRAAGVDLHVVEHTPGRPADGPPVLLLHGLCDSHLTWSRIAPTLARRRHVLSIDLPGHGLSGRPDASYALAWNASVIGAAIDALDLSEVDLVGHSYGGGVAQWLLLTHRARVRRLMLVAPGGLGRSVSAELRLASLGLLEHIGQPFFGVGTRIGLALAGGHFAPEETAEIRWMASRSGTARAASRTIGDVIDLRGQSRHFLDRAAEVADLPPMVIAWGDRDRVLPFAQAHEAAGHLTGVPLVRYQGVGHFPHREAAPRFVRDLESFLDAESLEIPRLARPVRVQVPALLERPPSLLARTWTAMVASVRRVFAQPGRTHEVSSPACAPGPAVSSY
jgi:pimeloyl-ACP methyl ester carboxylesterase